MPINYKVRSRGGRFKKDDFGDLGLRSYKEQQNEIIDALKAQNISAKQRDESYIRDRTRKDVKEEENKRDLKELDDKAWQTRRNAITVRSQTEYDYWMGIAKQYGEKQQYWDKFTKTGAQAFGKLAGAMASRAEKTEADRLTDEFIKGGRLYWVGAQTEGESTKIGAGAGADSINKKDKLTPFDQLHLNRTALSGNVTLSNNAAALIRDGDGDAIIMKLKSEFEGKWNKRFAAKTIIAGTKDYLLSFGVKPGTPGWRDAISFMTGKAGEEVRRLEGFDLYRGSQENIQAAITNYKSKQSTYNFNQLVVTLTNQHIKPPKGAGVFGPADHQMTMKDGYMQAVDLLMDNNIINNRADLDKVLAHLHPLQDKNGDLIPWSMYKESDIPTDIMGQYVGDTAHLKKDKRNRSSWGQRHNESTFIGFADKLDKKITDQVKKENNKIKADKLVQLTDLDARLNLPKDHKDYIDKNDPDQLGAYLDQHKDNEFIMAKYKFSHSFNPLSNTDGARQLHLNKAYKDRDRSRFLEIWNSLDPTAQKKRNWMFQGITDWNKVGLTLSSLQQEAKTIREGYEKQQLNSAIRHSSASKFDQAYINEYNRLDELYSNPDHEDHKELSNPFVRRTRIQSELKADIEEGKGLWRRTKPTESSGGNVVWEAFSAEPENKGNVITTDKIVDFKNNGLTYDNVITSLTKEQRAGETDVLQAASTDTIDLWLNQNFTSQPLAVTDEIKQISHLWNKQPWEVINDILEKKGFTPIAKPGPTDLAKLKVESFDTIYQERLQSEEDKIVMPKLKVNEQWFNGLPDTDKIKVGFVGDVYKETGKVPMKDNITVFRDAWIKEIPLSDIFTMETGITPTVDVDGSLYATPELILALPTYFPNYFYDYETNKIIKKRGK